MGHEDGAQFGRDHRDFSWHHKQTHFPGFYWSCTTGDHVGYESRPERDCLIMATSIPSVRPSIILKDLRDAASAVIPERDPSERAPEPSGNALSVARDIGFCAYWAIGDRITTARRRQAMTEAGWPEDLVTWATSGNASSLASASATA